MSRIAVVILNFNGRSFLQRFLPSVIQYSKEAEIVVADNASTDDSVEFLKSHFPELRLLINNKNSGFAGGYNWALSQLDSKYFVLLNSDIQVTENWLTPLLKLMESDKSIAVCQPKILSYNQKQLFEYAGASGGFIDKLGYPFCRGRVFENLEIDKGQYDDAREVFWATGACMFVRADVYHALDGLDDDFFAHMEEIDFCWRAKNEGFKIYVQPASIIYHVGGGTLPRNSSQKTYLNFRNNFALLYKNLPQNRLWKVLIIRLFLDGLAGLKFLLEGHGKDMLAVVRAHFYFYTHLNKLNIKRHQLTQQETSMIYQKSLVVEHFIRGSKKFHQFDPSDFS